MVCVATVRQQKLDRVLTAGPCVSASPILISMKVCLLKHFDTHICFQVKTTRLNVEAESKHFVESQMTKGKPMTLF